MPLADVLRDQPRFFSPPEENWTPTFMGTPGRSAQEDAYAMQRINAAEAIEEAYNPAEDLVPTSTVAKALKLGVPLALGSLAKYRMPMRLIKLRDRGERFEAKYGFRNKLGEPPARGFAEMYLTPKTGEANIHYLNLENPQARNTARGRVYGGSHLPGVRPEQLKESVGRLVEELSNAGYSKFTSEPLSMERGRLFERMMRKLKGEGKIPKQVSYTQDLQRYAASGSYEGRGLQGVRQRRAEGLRPREPRVSPELRGEEDFLDDTEIASVLNNPERRTEMEQVVRDLAPGLEDRYPDDFMGIVDDALLYQHHRATRRGSFTADELRRMGSPSPELAHWSDSALTNPSVALDELQQMLDRLGVPQDPYF